MFKGFNYINGKWVSGVETFPSRNPENGKTLGQAVLSKQTEVEQAAAAAKGAFPQWSSMTPKDRQAILVEAVRIIRARYGQQGEPTSLKKLICDEMGKPLPEADIEVAETADMLEFFARRGPEVLRDREVQLNRDLWPTKVSRIVFEPVGVIGVIKPWNYPFELPIWSIGAALISGNTIILKPSEFASFVGIEIGKIFEEAGVPPGVLNLVTGDDDTGRLLVNSPSVAMVSFTGSVTAGREVAQSCAKQLKKCNLELGGKDAAIVDRDADVELTANGLVWGAFANCGQVCTAVERVYIHQDIYNRLLQELVTKTKELRLGIEISPLVNEEQLAKVKSHVEDAKNKGARVVLGGHQVAGQELKGSTYYEPTILTEVNETMAVLKDETFGPVMPIIKVVDLDQAIDLANDSQYGLGASVWTSNVDNGLRVARRLRAGMVWINDVNVAFPECPWSGIKNSASGVELSDFSFYEYSSIKHVNYDRSTEKRRLWWYPY